MARPTIGYIALACYVSTIVAANAAIGTFGLVPVGLGLLAPAGVYFAGLAFVLRDILQDTLGRRWTLGAIAAGALLSGLLDPALAIASGGAFLLSELADMVVYTPLRRRSWLWAALASSTVGLAVDSVLFLWLAFGSLDFLAGQIVGKVWVTLLCVVIWGLVRGQRRAEVAR